MTLNYIFFFNFDTLESGIELMQGINVEPGKFGKKNKRKALNKRRASDFNFYINVGIAVISFFKSL